MKVELKHLSPYLPYGLKYQLYGNFPTKEGVENIIQDIKVIDLTNIQRVLDWETCKPILKSLSDYTDIFGLPMVELGCDLGDQAIIEEFANKKISLASLPYSAYEVLVRNKVDIFDLIPQNLAIDLNTLKP